VRPDQTPPDFIQVEIEQTSLRPEINPEKVCRLVCDPNRLVGDPTRLVCDPDKVDGRLALVEFGFPYSPSLIPLYIWRYLSFARYSELLVENRLIFIARQHTDVCLSVYLSVRDVPVLLDENGLIYCHSFLHRTVAQSF